MTKADTAKLLTIIIKAYPASRLQADDETLNLWHEMLSDLPVDIAASGTKALIATLKFPPSIADIREAVAKAMSEARGDLSVQDALAKLRRSFKLYGYYNPTGAREYLGEAIWRVVTMVAGSYVELCVLEDENWPARFERLYNGQAAQDMRQLQIPAQVQEHLKALGAAQGMKMIGGDSNS